MPRKYLVTLDPSILRIPLHSDTLGHYEKAVDYGLKLRSNSSFCCFGRKVLVLGTCCTEVYSLSSTTQMNTHGPHLSLSTLALMAS